MLFDKPEMYPDFPLIVGWVGQAEMSEGTRQLAKTLQLPPGVVPGGQGFGKLLSALRVGAVTPLIASLDF